MRAPGTPPLMLLLRLMVEVGSADEAEAQAREAAARLAPYGRNRGHTVEPYWKIPEYWEITCYVDPAGPPHSAYAQVLALAEAGWTTGGDEEDPWAVWNAEPGAALLAERVRWAEMRLVR